MLLANNFRSSFCPRDAQPDAQTVCLHPLRTGEGCTPVGTLVVFPEWLQPGGAWLPCVACAAVWARLPMGSSRGAVSAGLVMEAAPRMPTRLYEQREMG